MKPGQQGFKFKAGPSTAEPRKPRGPGMKKTPAVQGVCHFCGGAALGNYKGRPGFFKCASKECHKVFRVVRVA
jgi:hypothetical protein